MTERTVETHDSFKRKRNTMERLAAEAREAEPDREIAEELKKAAATERVDMIKAQAQQHQKSITAASVQIQNIQRKLESLRAELQLPPPANDDPAVAFYKKRIVELKEKIRTLEEELAVLTKTNHTTQAPPAN